jgi:hypothetical protein
MLFNCKFLFASVKFKKAIDYYIYIDANFKMSC